MFPIERMSQKEKDMIQYYIKKYYDTYLPYSAQSLNFDQHKMVDIDSLLCYWNKNKQELFNIMGQNLQIIKHVDVEATGETASIQKRQNFDYNFSALQKILLFIFKYAIKVNNSDLKRLYFSITSGDAPHYLFNATGLKEKLILKKEEKKIVIHPETKLTKALKMIIQLIDTQNEIQESIYEKACIEISQLTQNLIKRICGTFLFSIHPLDYLTMSDHSASWHTCMSWQKGGEYRIGTVEMLNSPMVVEVAYLEEPNCFTIDGCSWNDKKWRTQLIVTPGFISTIKSYPYSCPQFEKYAIAEMASLCNEYYAEPIFDIGKIETANRENPLPYRIETNNMYNDIYLAENHYYYYNEEFANAAFATLIKKFPNNFYNSEAFSNNKRLNYSGETECMCCGCIIDYMEDLGNVFCEDCLEIEEKELCYCNHCDRIIEDENQRIAMLNGDVLCPDCAINLCYHDEYNEQWLYEDECLFISSAFEDRWGVGADLILTVRREDFDIEDFVSTYFKEEYENILIKVFEWHLKRGLSSITIPHKMFN